MTVNERPLAEMLANDVLRDPITHGWLAPLAREYLKEIERADHVQREVKHVSRVVDGIRESGPVHDD